MITRLVLLGFLREDALHGYELKQIIEERMGDWTSIAFGSIYFALSKLAEEGFIEKIATEQEGGRPSRSVYQITEAGRDEFLRLLREAWNKLERVYFVVDVGIAFLTALPIEEIRGYLQRRVTKLEAIIEQVGEHRAERLGNPEVPRIAAAIFDHSLGHYQAELSWTRDFLDKINMGEYP